MLRKIYIIEKEREIFWLKLKKEIQKIDSKKEFSTKSIFIIINLLFYLFLWVIKTHIFYVTE